MNKQDILAAITQKEIQLKKLEDKVEISSICSDLYNKIVLEKAILKYDLAKLDRKPNFAEGLRNIFPKKKTLICDYFKGY